MLDADGNTMASTKPLDEDTKPPAGAKPKILCVRSSPIDPVTHEY